MKIGFASAMCFLLLGGAIFVVSVPAKRAAFAGTYTLDEANSDKIDNAIDEAVKKLNFLERYIARSHLKKLNPAYRSVSIASSVREITVTVDGQPALTAPANGSAVSWTGPDGAKASVSMRVEGGHLLQDFKSLDGHRVNDYTLSADGRTLTMQVTETSPRLSEPIRYRQIYRRGS